MAAPPTICVVAGVLLREERYLITQRRPNAVLPLLWEFPGGRVEDGETNEHALQREIRYRLAIEVEVGERIAFKHEPYKKAGYQVDFYLYQCVIREGTPRAQAVNDFKWVTSEEFDEHEFTPVDEASMTQLLGLNIRRR